MSIHALRSVSFQRLSFVAAAVTALMGTMPASAQSSDKSVYVGVSYGLGLPVPNNCRGAVACDRATDASKLFVGYKTTPNWAYEVTYFYFGKQARAFGPGVADSAILTESNRSWGAGLGISLEILPVRARGLLLAAAILSILLNPLMFGLIDRLNKRAALAEPARAE